VENFDLTYGIEIEENIKIAFHVPAIAFYVKSLETGICLVYSKFKR